MKAFTDINQSRKLAEILPIESADMWWCYFYDIISDTSEYGEEPILHKPLCEPELAIPCWSLSALLDVLRFPTLRYDIEDGEGGWIVSCEKDDKGYLSYYRDNPVDTCYEMIVKLHEQNLL